LTDKNHFPIILSTKTSSAKSEPDKINIAGMLAQAGVWKINKLKLEEDLCLIVRRTYPANNNNQETSMKLKLLLFILYQKLKRAAVRNTAYRSFLGGMQVKIMIKTADGKYGRLFIFDRGKLSTLAGGEHPYDAALIWSDSGTAFKVLSSGSDEQTFLAAAAGKLKIDGMAAYIQWFTDGIKLVMK
jgi:hypothetical protein